MNKLLVPGVGVLVVAVVIGVLANTSNQNVADSASTSDGDEALASTTRTLAAICSVTNHKQKCVDSLSAVAKNESAVPSDFIQAAIQLTITEIKAALNGTSEIGKSANDSLNKMAFDDCKELMDYAIMELQASFSMVGDSDIHTVARREAELRNWLSAVITYQQTCMDGFTQPELKSAMSDGLLNATALTSNALSIVSAISEIMLAFNIPWNSTFRNLQELGHDGDDDEYPSWFSSNDRKLVEASRNGVNPKPNAVVAKDGSGQYKTISAALAAAPKNSKDRHVIYVKAGIYDEYIIMEKDLTNIFMYGDGPRKTMVTGNKSNRGGYSTWKTATFSVIGTGFICKSMGFQNTAGPEGHQAVALRVQSDMSAFYNCRMDGYQDTLYAQVHRQFYRNCVISGTVDFIFGDSATVIQNSLIIVRKPMDNQQTTVTAHGREEANQPSGFVIQNCRIVPEEKLFPVRFKIPTYLGRPWKQYSRTVIMESTLADFIQPAGWLPWSGNFALDTLYYAEYANRGPGSPTDKRVNWKGYRVLKDRNEAQKFTAAEFIQAKQWLPMTGANYFLGFKP
ncbi:pectinesterase-like [Diospyros lotus]|uniref:pectinesterase-like n=1 Tax=Diospyros lotus TaxID=55363 RepID=UPI002252490A|nr:pectinesterase-like [Diospyros lotus]